MPERVEQHSEIRRYRFEQKRFKTVHAGRRSYKTEIAKRTLVAEANKNEDVSLFFGAPTQQQAKRLAWEDIKHFSPKWAIQKTYDSELRIKYKNGSEIWVLGFDEPARFDGKSQWHGGILDEYADMDKSVWDQHVSPALRDTHGWCWLIGVPEGKNHYYELSEYARNSGDPDWGDYQWKSKDVLDPIEIEKERSRLDERTFRQEYEGSFESYEGRAYVYYDHSVHELPCDVNPALAIVIACDFNISPCIWELGQTSERLTVFFDEIKQQQTDIWKMCVETKRRLEVLLGDESKRHRIIFYGDYSSSTRRDVSATASSWQIIRSEFTGWNAEYKLKANPRIVDRVNAFNSRLRNAAGQIQFKHSSHCVELRKDLDMVDMAMLKENKDTVGDRTHASDAVGYMINYEYPVISNVSRFE